MVIRRIKMADKKREGKQMEYIQRLPFILGGLAAFLTGIICFFNNIDKQHTYIEMTAALVIFFILGLYARVIFIGISDELDAKRKKEQELLEMQQLEAEMQLEKGNNIDYKVDGNDNKIMSDG
jgi:hypothetical protein